MNSKEDNNPGGSGVEGPGRETDDRPAPPSSSPEHSSAPSPSTVAPRDDYDEDDEDDEAPLPPGIIAASFEDDANKRKLIEDDDAGAGERMIAAPFEGYADEEEELLDEAEEDEAAPSPPEFKAASFEDEPGKPKAIQDDFVARGRDGRVDARGEVDDDDDEAPSPPEMIAAHFERKSYEEEKREEGDDDEEASRPPATTSSSREHIDNADQEAKRMFRDLIEGDAVEVPQVPEGRVTSSHEGEENTRSVMQDNDRFHEINNNDTPGNVTNREGRHGPSSLLSDRRHYTATNVQDGTFSVNPTHRSGNNSSLVPNSQDPMPISTNQELIAPPRSGYADTNNQSLPLLEATLLEDKPNVPVYDAIPVRHSWLRNNYKAVIIGTVLMAIAAIAAVITYFQMKQRGRNGDISAPTTATSVAPSSPPITTSVNSTTSPGNVFDTVTSAPTTAPMVWREQGPAIVGDDEYDNFGSSVVMSTNARTMMIGAPGYNNNQGHVEVYHKVDDGGNWTLLGQTIFGTATDDSFGSSVGIAADGRTIICGSPARYVEDRPGYVRVFKLVSDGDVGAATWVQIGQNITGEANGDGFGVSVSISDDGETIAIGAPWNDGMNGKGSGHVRIYYLDDGGTNWEKMGDDIDGDAFDDWFGYSLSLSANGTIVVIGAIYASVNEILTGGAKVYRIDSAGSSWERLGETIYGDNDGDCFGVSVDISSDGDTVAIGADQTYNNGPGYARVFSLEGSDNGGDAGHWKQMGGQKITGEAIGDYFGSSVSLSDDGMTIAIGAYGYNGNGDNSGHVRVYRMSHSESEWTQLGVDIYGEQAGEESGYSVSLLGDGYNTVAIGSPYYSNDDGSWVGQVKVYIVE